MDQQETVPQASQQKPQESLPPLTGTWPGAFKIYKYSKAAIRSNLKTIVLLVLVLIGINIVTNFIPILGPLLYMVASIIYSIAFTLVVIAGVRGKSLELNDTLSQSYKFIIRSFLLSILVSLAITGSLLLFIIPVFFVGPRLALSMYYLIDKDMGVIEAFQASWNNTKGHSGKIYGIFGANLAMALLAITIIGLPFAVYFLFMYSAATAVLYTFIQNNAVAGANLAQASGAPMPVTEPAPVAPVVEAPQAEAAPAPPEDAAPTPETPQNPTPSA